MIGNYLRVKLIVSYNTCARAAYECKVLRRACRDWHTYQDRDVRVTRRIFSRKVVVRFKPYVRVSDVVERLERSGALLTWID